jgi:hypothetical protein
VIVDVEFCISVQWVQIPASDAISAKKTSRASEGLSFVAENRGCLCFVVSVFSNIVTNVNRLRKYDHNGAVV